ncbi:MAG: alanine racemase [Clostridia bacterium]|nr:alanine racemase [Clostridia bacterium]
MLNKAYIDLNQLKANALAIKARLNKGVKFCAVVKADAYGHGDATVANALYTIADCYAVAIVEEGVRLRRTGIDKDILVFTPPFLSDIERAINFGLTLTVCSLDLALLIEKESKRQKVKTKIHLKFNTGMNRLGVDELEQLDKIAKRIAQSEWLILDGCYSHLGAPENKKLLKSAVNKFLLANNLVKGYNKKAICHISASGGFLQGVQADMVRVGILLYGYKPFPSDLVKVKPIMKVYAPVVCSRTALKGQNLLYGETTISQDRKVKLIRYGYADGLPRIKGKNQVANRCMDISAVEFNGAKKWYPVMDNASELANEYQTIPYEILVKATLRAERIYIT